ncbi:uncharacterized protein LOC114544956 [Dendronephthya gigantea]|uniref:uncharacterized protein LOC114542152 n=1 Tax=Dendronephthya gigantea TaxID=151771 RepID=UPI00106DC23C|nr:uncharacterized protein LOC114542152 [Dendronephthya gigantea]XP_028419224.1 uncharacterized protein LOC114544956 [Dendronephthya gigantea]
MIMGRLYNSLSKEMQKSKPSPNVINSYLNQEFKSRRARIKKMPATERCSRLFELYPCFKNPVEIIEEVRRINEKAANNDPKKFMNECVMRLKEELDVMLYFGCSKQRMELPKKPGKVSKVVQLMKNLHLLFGNGKLNKSAKKLIELIYVIKDHEDPETVCSRRQGKGIPLLCLDKTSAYLVCQGTLIFTVELRNIMQAVLALIGLFYLIDVDYPKSHELGLTMLHSLLFHDMNTPADLYNSFESAKEDYLKFKQNSSDDF